jgi:hypothetical protein
MKLNKFLRPRILCLALVFVFDLAGAAAPAHGDYRVKDG